MVGHAEHYMDILVKPKQFTLGLCLRLLTYATEITQNGLKQPFCFCSVQYTSGLK